MAIIINPFSPVAFSLGPIDIRWYALAYVVGFVAGYFLFRYLAARDDVIDITKKQVDDLLTSIVLGVIIGGRLGYVLFYNLGFFLVHPLEIFAVWHGGMSFHGGLAGVLVVTAWFAWRNRINVWRLLDLLAVVAPIGLFFGRIANFVNMEVMGRPTTMPWGVVFVGDTTVPRHPSPLYEAATEGVILFVMMFCLYRFTGLGRRPGAIAGLFAIGYAVARVVCEQFRAPDAQVGFLFGTNWLTMGMVLSAVMFIAGTAIFVRAIRTGDK